MSNRNSDRATKSAFEPVLFALVAALLFVLPWKNAFVLPLEFGPVSGVTPAKVLGVAVAVLWVLHKLADGRFDVTPPVVLFLLFCTWAVGSLVWANELTNAALRASQYVTGTVFLAIIWDLNGSIERIDVSSAALVAGGWITVNWTLLNAMNQVVKAGINSIRYGGGGYGGNNIAGLIVLILPFAWYLLGRVDRYLTTPQGRRLATATLAGYLPMAGVTVLLTGSRQGIVAYTVCLSVLFYTAIRRRAGGRPQLRNAALLLPTSMLVLALALAPPLEPVRKQLNNAFPYLFSPVRRIAQLPSLLAAGNLSSRLPNWMHALDVFLANPILGRGAGYLAVDNVFLSSLANLGLVGFLLLILPIWILFRDNVRLLFTTGENGHLLAVLLAWTIVAGLNIWGKSPVVWALLGLTVSQTYIRYRPERISPVSTDPDSYATNSD